MKKIVIFNLIIFNVLFINAQTHRFFYKVSFKKDSLSEKYITEDVVLDIGQNYVKFYPMDFLINDSIRINTGNYKYSYNEFDYQLIRKNNSNLNENFESFSPNYYVYNTSDCQKWEITADLKEDDGLKLQKAITKFGGRNWEAWFAPTIPFQEGPYKFRGLPGLIVEISDDKQQYIFQLYKSESIQKSYDTTFFLENLNTLKPIKISENKLKDLKINYFINPFKDYYSQKLIVKDENGNIKKIDYRELTKNQQEKIRRNNNPIEINKIINYPAK